MKKLGELGISPAPWRKAVNNFGMGENIIWDARSYRVAYSGIDSCFSFENQTANHNLMVAAPELYEALRGLLEIVCDDCKCPYKIEGKCVKCPRVVSAEKALAKAAGEDVCK